MPKESKFAAVQQRPSQGSPKTQANRSAYSSKRGLEISHLRDDNAFRTAKSRAISKLRKSDEWSTLNEEQRQQREEAIVAELEVTRDAKKRAHEIEWLKKMESGDIKEDEMPDYPSEEDDVREGDEEEWEDEEEWVSEEVSSADKRVVRSVFEEVREKSKQEWIGLMNVLEKAAVDSAKDWEAHDDRPVDDVMDTGE